MNITKKQVNNFYSKVTTGIFFFLCGLVVLGMVSGIVKGNGGIDHSGTINSLRMENAAIDSELIEAKKDYAAGEAILLEGKNLMDEGGAKMDASKARAEELRLKQESNITEINRLMDEMAGLAHDQK